MDIKSIINQILFEEKGMIRGEGDPTKLNVEPHLSDNSVHADANSGVLGAGKNRTDTDREKTRQDIFNDLMSKNHFAEQLTKIKEGVKSNLKPVVPQTLKSIAFQRDSGESVYNALKSTVEDLKVEYEQYLIQLNKTILIYNESVLRHHGGAHTTSKQYFSIQTFDISKGIDGFYGVLAANAQQAHIFNHLVGLHGIDITMLVGGRLPKIGHRADMEGTNAPNPDTAGSNILRYMNKIVLNPKYNLVLKEIMPAISSMLELIKKAEGNRVLTDVLSHKLKKLSNLYNPDGTLKNKPAAKQKLAKEVGEAAANKFSDDDYMMYVILSDDGDADEFTVDVRDEIEMLRNKFVKKIVDERMSDFESGGNIATGKEEPEKKEPDEETPITESKVPELKEPEQTRTRKVSEKTRLRELWESNKKEIFHKNISNTPNKTDSGLHLGGM